MFAHREFGREGAPSEACPCAGCGFILGAASFSPAVAQNVQTREITYFSETSGGENVGCGIEFLYTFIDLKYTGDKLAAMDGSLTNFFGNGLIFTLLKIAGFDFPNGPTEAHVSFPIFQAAFSVGRELIRPNKFNCTAPQKAYCGRLEFNQSSKILTALDQKQPVTLVFNREAGNLDYNFPFGNDPGSQQDQAKYQQEYLTYLDCMSKLLARAQANMSSPQPSH
jgi:hypothetical protein